MRIFALAFAATLALVAAAPAQAQQSAAPDGLVYIDGSDAEMAAAVKKAQAELPVFFAHVSSPGPDESFFAIKYNLTPDGKAEFIWAEVISHKGDVTVARLANEPRDPRFKIGQQVTVRNGEIIDWGYFSGGTMRGNYTTRVLLGHMDPEEAAEVREAYGW